MTDERLTAGEAAERLEGRLEGDPERPVTGLAPLETAGPDQLAFVLDPTRNADALRASAAGTILVPARAELEAPADVNYVHVQNVRAAWASASAWFGAPRRGRSPGVHPTALVDPEAEVDASATVGPGAVVGARSVVGPRSVIEAHCVLGEGVHVGADCFLHPRVTLLDGVVLGDRVLVHSGTVIGSDGFGFAPVEGGRWQKIEQLGRVVIGSDVEIGANTAIDRGALHDTRIGDGVKIDNLVHIAHNVEIGDHTAIAGCVGVAGSARIGAHCAIGGGVGIAGHLSIADHVTLHGMTMVTRSIDRPGHYASGVPHQEARLWNRMLANLRRMTREGSGTGKGE